MADISALLAGIPTDPEDVPLYLQQAIPALVEALQEAGDIQRKLDVEPDKPREGDLRYADGTNWDPGSGAGLYRYTAAAWVLIMGSGGAGIYLPLAGGTMTGVLKVDTINETAWHHIDRPYGKMDYDDILKGMKLFSEEFKDFLTVETMLVKDVNDKTDDLRKTAEFIKKLNPKVTYISIPTRPPAEDWALPPDTDKINESFQIYSSVLDEVQLTTQYEGNQYASTGNFEDDFLNIIAVHPMRKEAVEELLKKSNTDWKSVDRLIADDKVKTSQFDGKTFYMRNLKRIFKESHQN